jgi:hypothetical protein
MLKIKLKYYKCQSFHVTKAQTISEDHFRQNKPITAKHIYLFIRRFSGLYLLMEVKAKVKVKVKVKDKNVLRIFERKKLRSIYSQIKENGICISKYNHKI